MQPMESIRDRMQDSGTQLLDVSLNQKIYERKEGNGYARMVSQTIFDGIDIVYNDVVMEQIHHNAKPLNGLFEIHFCEDGRIECSFANGKCLYMNGGDISLGWKNCDAFRHSSYFPTGFYKGLSLAVYVPKAQAAIDEFVGQNSINLADICNRFCMGQGFGLVKDTGRLRELFLDLYKVPTILPDVYLRLKCVEIFVLLSTLPSIRGDERVYFERGQVETIKHIHDELLADLGNHHTIEALSERHRISMTALKRCFKGVYGITMYQYVKRCRMRSAAKDLVESDDTILTIANRWGYENGSKFSGAFKQIMGCNPREYRLKNKMS